MSGDTTSNKHTLYVYVDGSLPDDIFKKRVLSFASRIEKKLTDMGESTLDRRQIEFNIVHLRDRADKFCIMWVYDFRVANLMLLLNPDGGKRVKYEQDNFEELPNESDDWYSESQIKEVPVEPLVNRDPIKHNGEIYDLVYTRYDAPYPDERYDKNVLVCTPKKDRNGRVPEWCVVAIKTKFQNYCKGKVTASLSPAGKVFVNFQDDDAIFVNAMLKFFTVQNKTAKYELVCNYKYIN